MSRDDVPGSIEPQTKGRRTDRVLAVLRHGRRRRVLTRLADAPDGGPLRVADVRPDRVDDTGVAGEPLATELRHVHLPKLAAAGYVEWDREAGELHLGPAYDEVGPFVDLLRANADALPTGWP